jgi:hypothetical protein
MPPSSGTSKVAPRGTKRKSSSPRGCVRPGCGRDKFGARNTRPPALRAPRDPAQTHDRGIRPAPRKRANSLAGAAADPESEPMRSSAGRSSHARLSTCAAWIPAPSTKFGACAESDPIGSGCQFLPPRKTTGRDELAAERGDRRFVVCPSASPTLKILQ